MSVIGRRLCQNRLWCSSCCLSIYKSKGSQWVGLNKEVERSVENCDHVGYSSHRTTPSFPGCVAPQRWKTTPFEPGFWGACVTGGRVDHLLLHCFLISQMSFTFWLCLPLSFDRSDIWQGIRHLPGWSLNEWDRFSACILIGRARSNMTHWLQASADCLSLWTVSSTVRRKMTTSDRKYSWTNAWAVLLCGLVLTSLQSHWHIKVSY